MKMVLFPKMKGNGSPEKVTQVQPPESRAGPPSLCCSCASICDTYYTCSEVKGSFFPNRIYFTVFSTQIEIRLFLMGEKSLYINNL